MIRLRQHHRLKAKHLVVSSACTRGQTTGSAGVINIIIIMVDFYIKVSVLEGVIHALRNYGGSPDENDLRLEQRTKAECSVGSAGCLH